MATGRCVGNGRVADSGVSLGARATGVCIEAAAAVCGAARAGVHAADCVEARRPGVWRVALGVAGGTDGFRDAGSLMRIVPSELVLAELCRELCDE